MRRPSKAPGLAVLAGLVLGLTLPVAAAEARDYEFLLVQGKLSHARQGLPMEGITVRLEQDGRVFEAVTDRRGVFVFEKLPVGPYELRIATRDGKVIRSTGKLDPTDPSGARVRVRLGRGSGIGITLETADGEVAAVVPEPRVKWRRLWKELGIFVGAVGLLAL